jgi:hypothetical protein
MGPLIPRSFRWHPNDDGTIDGLYPNGDKPTAGLSWDLTLALVGLTIGGSFSQDVRAGLLGANADDAVIQVITVAGADAAASGWVEPGLGDNLTVASILAEHDGFLKLRAVDPISGQATDTQSFAWSFVAPTGADTKPPTIPTGFSVFPIEDGVRISHDASGDPRPGAVNASGTKDYRTRLNGTVVHTEPGQPGLSPVLTLYNIGDITLPGAPTAVQDANDPTKWVLTAAGTGFHGTQSDQFAFLACPVSGDVRITVQVNSYTGPNAFSPVGPMFRNTLAVNSPFVCSYAEPTVPGNGHQVKTRVLPTNNSTNVYSDLTFDPPCSFQLERLVSANKVSVRRRKLTEADWTNVIDVTTPVLDLNLYAGIAFASQSAGNNFTVTIEQLNINNAPKLTYDVTSATGGAWTVSARDTNNYESAVSISITADPLDEPDDEAVNLVRGHGVWFSSAYWNDTQKAGLLSLFNSIAGNDKIKFVQYIPLWRQAVSGGSPDGDRNAHYAKTREICDWLMATCQAISPDKYVVFSVGERAYGQGIADVAPQYLIDQGQYVEAPKGSDGKFIPFTGGLTCCTKQWDVPTRDYFIDLGEYIASQYDSVDNFAMYGAGESAIGVPIGLGGFNYPAFATQTKRVFQVLKAAFKKTPIRWKVNFWDTPASLLEMYEYLRTITKLGGVVFGGPDPEFDLPFPFSTPNTAHRSITANRLWCGNTQNTSGAWQPSGGFDYRGKDPWIHESQAFWMEGVRSGYNETPADMFDYAYNGMKADMILWLAQTYTGNTSQKWTGASGLKAFVDSKNGLINDNSATLRGSWNYL